MRLFRGCQHTVLSRLIARQRDTDLDQQVRVLSLSCTSHFCCQSYTTRHHVIGTSDARRSSNPSTIRLGACCLRCVFHWHSHINKESPPFSIGCAVTVARSLGLCWEAPHLYRLQTSKVLVCEPLFMSAWKANCAKQGAKNCANRTFQIDLDSTNRSQ